jgi:hypothetical protein
LGTIANIGNSGLLGITNSGLLGISNSGLVGISNSGLVGISNSGLVGISNSGLVNSDMMLVNDGGLVDVLDGVDHVGLGNGIRLGHIDIVRLGHPGLVDHLSLDGDRDSDRDLDGVPVDLELGLDAGQLGGDDGVGSDGGGDHLLGDGVSRGGSLVGGCRRDGSIGKGSIGEDGRSDGHGGLAIPGLTSNIGVGGGLLDGLTGLDVVVSNLDGLGADLNGTVSNDLIDGVIDGGASMNLLLDGLSDDLGGTDMLGVRAVLGDCPH